MLCNSKICLYVTFVVAIKLQHLLQLIWYHWKANLFSCGLPQGTPLDAAFIPKILGKLTQPWSNAYRRLLFR